MHIVRSRQALKLQNRTLKTICAAGNGNLSRLAEDASHASHQFTAEGALIGAGEGLYLSLISRVRGQKLTRALDTKGQARILRFAKRAVFVNY